MKSDRAGQCDHDLIQRQGYAMARSVVEIFRPGSIKGDVKSKHFS